MKASEMISELQELIEEYGDREIKIIGVFQGEVFTDFFVDASENYIDESIMTPGKDFGIKNTFLIDRM